MIKASKSQLVKSIENLFRRIGEPIIRFATSNLSGCIPGEVKHLSSQRKRNRIDTLSSGERKGQSLNFLSAVFIWLVGRVIRIEHLKLVDSLQ